MGTSNTYIWVTWSTQTVATWLLGVNLVWNLFLSGKWPSRSSRPLGLLFLKQKRFCIFPIFFPFSLTWHLMGAKFSKGYCFKSPLNYSKLQLSVSYIGYSYSYDCFSTKLYIHVSRQLKILLSDCCCCVVLWLVFFFFFLVVVFFLFLFFEILWIEIFMIFWNFTITTCGKC